MRKLMTNRKRIINKDENNIDTIHNNSLYTKSNNYDYAKIDPKRVEDSDSILTNFRLQWINEIKITKKYGNRYITNVYILGEYMWRLIVGQLNCRDANCLSLVSKTSRCGFLSVLEHLGYTKRCVILNAEELFMLNANIIALQLIWKQGYININTNNMIFPHVERLWLDSLTTEQLLHVLERIKFPNLKAVSIPYSQKALSAICQYQPSINIIEFIVNESVMRSMGTEPINIRIPSTIKIRYKLRNQGYNYAPRGFKELNPFVLVAFVVGVFVLMISILVYRSVCKYF